MAGALTPGIRARMPLLKVLNTAINLPAIRHDLGDNLILYSSDFSGIGDPLLRRQAAVDRGERRFLQLDKGANQSLSLGGNTSDFGIQILSCPMADGRCKAAITVVNPAARQIDIGRNKVVALRLCQPQRPG